MAARKTKGGSGGPSPETLHIAVTQRIVGKHHNQLRMPLKTVRFVLDKALREAGTTIESRDDVRMREQLERDIGLSLAEIVELSKRWPT